MAEEGKGRRLEEWGRGEVKVWVWGRWGMWLKAHGSSVLQRGTGRRQ